MNRNTPFRRGLTLIELCTSCAVACLLLAAILPLHRRERLAASQAEEQSLARRMMASVTSFTQHNRDRIFPSAPHWSWITRPVNMKYNLVPEDPFRRGHEVYEGITKVWTLHYLSWDVTLAPEKMQLDAATRAVFSTRSVVGFGEPREYPDNTSQCAYAFHPSLGMNATYLGGAYKLGAFRGQGPSGAGMPYGNPTPAPNPRSAGGQFYVQFLSAVARPAELVAFASARGGDVMGTSFTGFGGSLSDQTTCRPGFHAIRPPTPHPSGWGQNGAAYTLAGGWNSSNVFDSNNVPSSWGNLDLRYPDGIVTVAIDGHVAMQTLSQLRDMRKWANIAKSADWTFPTDPSQIRW